GRYGKTVTVIGSVRTALGAAPVGCAELSGVSFRPTAADACDRAGWSTPVARLTASVPARGLVSSWTSGLEVAREAPVRATRLLVNPGGITTVAYSLPISI